MKAVALAIGLVVLSLWGSSAQALPKVGASLGQGLLLNGGNAATPFNVEVTPSWSFLVVQADLGLLMEMNKSQDFVITPGARINLLGFFAKAGLPLRTTHEFDWGFRLGAGYTLFSLAIADLFVEVDGWFWKKVDFKDVVPVEGRVGVEFGF